VRGAGTLRYGSQAIGGVVQVLNNRVPTALPTQSISTELNGSYDTVANTWQGSGLADVALGNFALHADGFYRDAGDYDTPLGKQANSFFRGHGESVGGSYFFGGDSRIGAAITQYNAKYGIPSDDTYIDMKQTKVMTRSSFGLGNGLLKTLNVDGSYADYQHSEVEPDGTIATTFKNKEYDGRAELLFDKLGFVENSALGVEYQHRDFSAIGEDSSYLFPATAETFAGYFFADMQPVEHLHLETSGRIDHIQVQGTPASDVFSKLDYTPLSGAVSALYDFGGGVKLGATFSSTGRAPALTELFARGGHDGPGTFETGDPSLKIERANSLEGSLRVHTGRFLLAACATMTASAPWMVTAISRSSSIASKVRIFAGWRAKRITSWSRRIVGRSISSCSPTIRALRLAAAATCHASRPTVSAADSTGRAIGWIRA
jgi:iron complex outermembrane recepter protein